MRLHEVDKLRRYAEEREHAHWILDGKPMVIVLKYKCSNCGNRSSKQDRFCSYCGARMDEEVNETQEVKDGVIISINRED